MAFALPTIAERNRPGIREFIRDHWHGDIIVAHGWCAFLIRFKAKLLKLAMLRSAGSSHLRTPMKNQ